MTTSIAPYAGEPQPTFNPHQHLIQIPNKGGKADYLPVQWRLVWFRQLCPQGTIDTEELEVDLDRECEAEVYAWNQDARRSEKTLKRAAGYARFRATVTDGKGGRATATKTERAVDFPDYVEKAETGAVGRALAMLGYGTQFIGDDLNEEHRIVDAPVEKRQPSEQERKAYTERKPFVEGTVAAPGTEHLTNGDGSPAFPERMKPSDVEKLYSDFWLWTGSDDEGIVRKRWEVWKQSLFKQVIADQDLNVSHGEVMLERLAAAKEKKAK